MSSTQDTVVGPELDQAAVDAMRPALSSIPMDGIVVIGVEKLVGRLRTRTR